MKQLISLLTLILLGCSGTPSQHFIYDVTETGHAHLAAKYFQDGTDYEGYYWSETWKEWASKSWDYQAINGNLDWVETPGIDSSQSFSPTSDGTYLLNVPQLKPTESIPQQYFTGKYETIHTRTFKLVLLEEEFEINTQQYIEILKRKKSGLGVWIDNYGYVSEKDVSNEVKNPQAK